MTVSTNSHHLAALLDWYRAMGVNDVVDDAPIDWTARGDAAPGANFSLPHKDEANAHSAGLADTVGDAGRPNAAPLRARTAPSSAPTGDRRPTRKPAAPDAAEQAAREVAGAAESLDALREALSRFDGCGLKKTAKNLCFFRGSPTARLMIIGEAPGRDEDLAGQPFVGRAGQMLDKMLCAIGLGEPDVHITNIVYWRPPGNRTPTPQEAQVCRPFLERQIALVKPDVLLMLGGPAAKAILDVTEGIMKVRGKWRTAEIGGETYKAIATLHPAYLLRTPAAKRQAWRDLLEINAALQGTKGRS